MKALSLLCASIASLALMAAASHAGNTTKPTTAPSPYSTTTQPAEQAGGEARAALEQMILGTWYGPDCGGDYTFHPDGTFEVQSFTPGQNTLAGSWSIRWDALPPTLLVTCKSSDFTRKDPTRPEYELLGKPQEFKILELNADALSIHSSKEEWVTHYTRKAEDGGFVTRK